MTGLLAPPAPDPVTAQVLREQQLQAEGWVNGMRIAVLSVMALAAALYASFIPPSLNLVNVVVLSAGLAWALAQRTGLVPPSPRLSAFNVLFDVSAVSLLTTAYGLLGDANFAVKAPALIVYLIVLAAGTFTGSPGVVLLNTLAAVVQYTALSAFFVVSGRLALGDPTSSMVGSGTSLLDEGAKLLLLASGGIVAAVACAWNEQTLRRTAAAQRKLEQRFRAVFDHSAVGVALLSEAGAILDANPAIGRILGLDPAAMRGRGFADLMAPQHRAMGTQLVQNVSSGIDRSDSIDVLFARSDGETVWGSSTVSRADGVEGVGLVAVVEDVSDRKELEANLVRQALHDHLTGLANRTLFRDRTERALARAQRDRAGVAVLLLDLDHFKDVNDSLGHAAGDGLLQVVAKRLLGATRGCDTVARLGGDEFAVLLENASSDEDCAVVARRISGVLELPVELPDGSAVHVAASIGIARAADAESVEVLLRNADIAMYEAKALARGRYICFDASMSTTRQERVRLESDLRRGLERGEVWVAYQPIIDLISGSVVGVEALARWDHPTRGSVPPASFIPLAQETGLMPSIGRLVLNEACREAAEWNRIGGPARPVMLTVNLSAAELKAPGLPDQVRSALERAGLEARQLVLEITETDAMATGDETLDRMRELKALGVRLAIDDFGTGYSSLAYLQQLPVDILKIDRSFVHGLMRGPNEDAVTRTIISLGKLLSLPTVAEGIEHEGQYQRLRELGCDYGQGFLMSQPVRAREVSTILQAGLGVGAEAEEVLDGAL